MSKFLPISKIGRMGAAIALSGAAGATALAATPGTFGGFSATSSNPGNSVKAGTVTMTNSVTPCTAAGVCGALTFTGLSSPYSTTNMEPGQSVSGTVTIKNTGSLPVTATLAATGTTGTVTPASDWTLSIKDENNNTIYSDNLANFSATSLPATTASTWAPGESHIYTVTVGLAAGANNEAQGSTPSFELDWAFTQA